jgi:hypothetical protein
MNELDPESRQLARELGTLRLLWLDMSHARSLFERLAEMPDGFGDFRIASALWISGLIAYRRCVTGAPISHDLVNALEPPQRELHDDALLMAERHAANRATNDHDVEVWLEIDHGPPPRVRSVRTRQIMPGTRTHSAFEFAALAKHLADRLEERCRQVEVELVASANSSGVARWSTPSGESPEWVNILSGDADSISSDTPTTT